eukprot:CAMPEP_0178452092 /NCGR_PEP_ID=MMETSP0689_2-20121128/44048_1 /TAXON_ID=160604 /ORGANISM="Amphidinium massartii, Strain CS-259" /LENGTH=766 /DNA_ID=CAMNT_0020077751 /DNA_START=13 /DNA_END=2313 /DNA_ORIENTATION=-
MPTMRRPLALLALAVSTDALAQTAVRGGPRISFISVNDVYKLVGLSSELPYMYLNADVNEIQEIASKSCNGELCGLASGDQCGIGDQWEACFPIAFPQVQYRSMKAGPYENGPTVVPGPCGGGDFSEEEEYGHMVDFTATFKWLKDEEAASGAFPIGTLAGDFIAPSYLAELHRGKQMIEAMNHMGVDLVNIGNHDVDFGMDVLSEQMQRSRFHYLNANLRVMDGDLITQPMVSNRSVEGNSGVYPASPWRQLDTSTTDSYGKGFATMSFNGSKVCVLGTTDVDKMSWKGKKVDGFQRDIPAAIEIMEMWEDNGVGCDLKVALTHTRSEAAGLHLDAIIAAHDHYAFFGELKRSDGGTTFLVKAGSDARVVSKLTFDMSSGYPVGTQELVPVVTGSCKKKVKGKGRKDWYKHAMKLFNDYAKPAEEAARIPMHIKYSGLYDTSSVRERETRAVDLWLDAMRESLEGDVVFFQAGLIRQDMSQEFKREVELSEIFLLEEYPWADLDADSRSSLFPFHVSIETLVETTLPWMAKKFWCSGPFSDPNRVHMSGFMAEVNESSAGCQGDDKVNPLDTITFVGGCHIHGGLQLPLADCCKSPACGRLWTKGAWDPRVTDEMKQEKLLVLTSQHCTPSKEGSHGGGFHAAGMVCPGVEDHETPKDGPQLVPPSSHTKQFAAQNFEKYGYPFKPAMIDMLRSHMSKGGWRSGFETEAECQEAVGVYDASSFLAFCTEDTKNGGTHPFPRFFLEESVHGKSKVMCENSVHEYAS